MAIPQKRPHSPKTWQSLVINFALPLFILTRLSSDRYLGATGALIAALAIPIAYELVGFVRNRKVQVLSLVAIGGILVTGAIGLLGLSENWLAVRRSVIYLAGSIGIGVFALKSISVTEFILKQAVDWQTIQTSSKKSGNSRALTHSLRRSDFALMLLAAAMTIASFVLTKVVIDAPAGTTEFNQQYAELRVISLAAITGPLLVGLVIIVTSLLIKIEKLTGLSSDQLTTKKH